MLILPAIDLRGGQCVRLVQGDYARETVFDDDPAAVACRWEEQGATWIHVVDLDGARAGSLVNLEALAAIRRAVGAQLEFGGGVRTLQQVETLLAAGVNRVVLGTVALEQPALVETACARFGAAIAVSLDCRDGRVAVRGWLEQGERRGVDVAREMERRGVPRLIFTDIARDGTLAGPNESSLRELLASASVPVIASGGVATLDHLRRLARLGVEGAIVGRALYTGEVRLAEAIAELAG